MYCAFCGRECKNDNSLRNHERLCKENPNKQKHPKGFLGKAHSGLSCKEKLELGVMTQDAYDRLIDGAKRGGSISSGIGATPEIENTRKRKLSIVAKQRNLGGYVKGSGRGKKGWYKGFFCDSSWELAYVIYCLDHNIEIQRNTEKREYIWNNRHRNYIPDFIVGNQLVEIKGYSSPQWEAKIKYNQDVIVLYEKDLKHVFDYIIQKYGKDYTKLYE